MRYKLGGLLIILAILLFFPSITPVKATRSFLEQHLVIPIRKLLYKPAEPMNSLQILSLQEEIKQLKNENRIMKKQLGAIPEKATLWPATVIWQGDSEFIVHFENRKNQDLIGCPVIFGYVYLGKVVKQSPRMLAVRMPTNSSFIENGISETNIEGKIKGKFNTQVIFEFDNKSGLQKGTRIYYLNKTFGWRFLLGSVSGVDQNKRLSTQQAAIDYLPSQTQLTTVFLIY